MTLGSHLREKRLAMKLPFSKKVSTANLAGLVGCSTTFMYQLERDIKLPSLPMAVKVAKAYGTTLDQMVKAMQKQQEKRHDLPVA